MSGSWRTGIVFEADEIAPLKSLARRRHHGMKVLLDSTALDASAREEWQALIELALQALGLDASIGSFSGAPPDDRADFVYVADSAALSRKLLLNVPLVYIQPRSAPTRIDAYLHWKLLEQSGRTSSWQPVVHSVTLISSIFRGDEFLPGFLENCSRLQGYEDCEHFLIRAGSPGGEHGRLVEHVRQRPSAVYLNLAEDPGLYEVWNLGSRLATGRYLSNANIDDRRAPEHVAKLKAVLDGDPDVDVASTSLRVTKQRNLAWDDSEGCQILFSFTDDQQVTGEALMTRAYHNIPHCMPMWRRSLHSRVGSFDEKRYGATADKAFWLRAGSQGSIFHLSAQPLGLYLWDIESYFHQDSSNRQADQRIVAEYSAMLGSATKPRCRRCQVPLNRPLSHEIGDAIDLLKAGAVLEGMGRLLNLALLDHRLGAAGYALLHRVVDRFFGCKDFPNLLSRYRDAQGPGFLANIALFNVWVDLVHTLGAETSKSRRTLELACIDLSECFGEFRGLLLIALLSRKRGNLGFEQAILRQLHETDSAMFWRIIQQVYRFTVPLPELCGTVSHISPQFEPEHPLAKYQVVFYPVSSGNAYQNALYRFLRDTGGIARGTSDEEVFLGTALQPNSENVLHVHWINRLFWPPEVREKSIKQRAEAFLDGLRKQQRNGFKIFWTIHNRLSHETGNPEAEVAFRQALYRLSDRVFIHHPLAADLLDWLPDRNKLCLCEHGHYDLSAPQAISRSAARARLGLAEDDFVITHLGNIRDYKGLNEVLPVLMDQLDVDQRMKLVIGGRIRSREVSSLLKTHPHRNLIIHDGYLSDEELLCHMRASDFGLLSYGAILTSGSLFHWLSCGCPVLAPMIGTIPAYLVDGWNGYSYRDANALREVLSNCAELSGGEVARLGNNARMTAQQMEWRMWRQ